MEDSDRSKDGQRLALELGFRNPGTISEAPRTAAGAQPARYRSFQPARHHQNERGRRSKSTALTAVSVPGAGDGSALKRNDGHLVRNQQAPRGRASQCASDRTGHALGMGVGLSQEGRKGFT